MTKVLWTWFVVPGNFPVTQLLVHVYRVVLVCYFRPALTTLKEKRKIRIVHSWVEWLKGGCYRGRQPHTVQKKLLNRSCVFRNIFYFLNCLYIIFKKIFLKLVAFNGKVGKVAHEPRRLTQLELILVSVAWSNWEYCYSPLDGMLVHCWVTPSSMLPVPILYTWLERDNAE